MSDNGIETLHKENAQLRAQVEHLTARVTDQHNTPDPPMRNALAAFRFIGAVLAVVVPVLSCAWYLINLQIASAETRMKLQTRENVSALVDTSVELRLRGVATRDQVAAQEQHLSDIDRRLYEIDQKLTKLLERRR